MAEAERFANQFDDVSVVIAEDDDTSEAIECHGLTPTAILCPAAMDGATLTFTADNAAGGYAAVNGLSLTVAVGEWLPIEPKDAVALGHNFKIVSDASETAARTLIVRLRVV